MNNCALTIGEDYCWGCMTCEVACKQENGAADGVKLISVWKDGPRMLAGKLDLSFRVRVYRHCDDPPCAAACPAEAIAKRPDGIVVLDEGECTECRACMEACPYTCWPSPLLNARKSVAKYERIYIFLLTANKKFVKIITK